MSTRYQQMAPVMFGAGAVKELGDVLKEYGCSKVMLVYDQGVKAAGLAQKAIDAVEKAGIPYVIYDGVVPDPEDIACDAVGKMAAEAGIDGVIGIGGGSSMDTAKAVSILMKHPAPISQYLNPNGAPYTIDGGIPIFLIPTTGGTGSEVTNMCIITHTQSNTKLPVYISATLAIVDPEMCITAPPSVTANAGLDALAHAMESVTACGHNDYCDTLALEAIRRIACYLPAACRDGSDLEARTQMSLASNFAGIAFTNTNVHVGHAAGDLIASIYHTPHGLNCAWANAAVQEFVAPVVPDRVRRIGKALGVSFTGTESPQEIGSLTADAIRTLTRACGIQSMEEYGIDRQMLLDNASFIAKSDLRHNCPREVTVESAAELLANAYDRF